MNSVCRIAHAGHVTPPISLASCSGRNGSEVQSQNEGNTRGLASSCLESSSLFDHRCANLERAADSRAINSIQLCNTTGSEAPCGPR